MKYLSIFFLFFSCMNHTEAQKTVQKTTKETTKETMEENFSFTLRLSHIEKSKDSHTVTEFWRVQKGELAYQKTYTGRLGARKPEKLNQTLTQTQLATLSDMITDFGLQQDIDIPKHSEFATPYTAISVVWELKRDEKAFRIELYDHIKNIDEDKIYQSLKEIIAFLKK